MSTLELIMMWSHNGFVGSRLQHGIYSVPSLLLPYSLVLEKESLLGFFLLKLKRTYRLALRQKNSSSNVVGSEVIICSDPRLYTPDVWIIQIFG